MNFLTETGLEAPASERNEDQYIRFFLPRGGKAQLVFFTEADRAKSFYEHKVKVGGMWKSFTCMQCAGEHCPMCAYAEKEKRAFRSFGTLFTVMNIAPRMDKQGKPVVDKDGNPYPPKKQILVVGKKALSTIIKANYENLKDVGKGLKGAKFAVTRGPGELSLGMGDAYTYSGHVDLTPYGDEEIDYQKYLMPDRAAMEEALEMLISGASFDTPSEVDWK